MQNLNHVIHFDITNNLINNEFIKIFCSLCEKKSIDIDFSKKLDEYLKNQNAISPKEENNKWIPFIPFQESLFLINNQNGYYALRDLAKELMIESKELYIEDSYKKDLVKTILNLTNIYAHLVRGDKVGLWQIENLSDGFAIIKENTALPSSFIEGYLRGLLKVQSAVGVNISLIAEQNPENFSNVYEIAWMRNLVNAEIEDVKTFS